MKIIQADFRGITQSQVLGTISCEDIQNSIFDLHELALQATVRDRNDFPQRCRSLQTVMERAFNGVIRTIGIYCCGVLIRRLRIAFDDNIGSPRGSAVLGWTL